MQMALRRRRRGHPSLRPALRARRMQHSEKQTRLPRRRKRRKSGRTQRRSQVLCDCVAALVLNYVVNDARFARGVHNFERSADWWSGVPCTYIPVPIDLSSSQLFTGCLSAQSVGSVHELSAAQARRRMRRVTHSSLMCKQHRDHFQTHVHGSVLIAGM